MNRGRRHAGWAVALLGLLSMRVFAVETSQQQAADSKAYLAQVSDLFKKEWPIAPSISSATDIAFPPDTSGLLRWIRPMLIPICFSWA